MASEHEITEELKALGSPLAGLSRAMPYAVPEGYFNGLDAHVFAGVMASESDDMQPSFSKEMPFALPQHYFEELAAQVSVMTVLPTVQSPAFDVPANYFDELPARVLTAIHRDAAPAKTTRIIAFNPLHRAVRWAAAAVVVLGLGLGSYHIYYTPDRKAQHQLARLDGASISDYVGQEVAPSQEGNAIAINTSAASAVKTLSNDEITNYLDETGYEDPVAAE